ncbi:hypothetical protein AHAS_Ahas17G0108400 [Arachis hypogaea]
MILLDRATKKDDKNLLGKIASKRGIKGKITVPRKQSPPLSSSRIQAAARSADRTPKNDALNELRAKRLKQQDLEAHRRLREASRVSGS